MTPEQAQISRLRADLEAVTAERDYLRGELGMLNDSARVLGLMSNAGLTATEAAMVDRLYSFPGKAISRDRLLAQAWGDRADDVEIGIITVYVCKVRRKLGADVIENVWGHGYRLTPRGRQIVDDATAQRVAA